LPGEGLVEREPEAVGRLGAEEREIAIRAGPPPMNGAPLAASPRDRLPRFCARCEGSGAAFTTVTGRLPAAGGSASDSGGASEPRVTSVGSATAAAKALPVTAAVAKMARALLTSSPTFADSLAHGIGGICGLPKFMRNS
jgi:hypothetical protein